MTRFIFYQPPFPYFGGKSSVADVVWKALGADVVNYVEPFAGSAAVLMLRPGGAGHVETINDADGFICNAWRAIKHASDEVAHWADEIVSEAELHARHIWLVGRRERLTEKLCGDVDFYDAKAAGFWIWGQCCWIGSGWCTGKGAWTSENGEFVLGNTGQGVKRQRPHLGDTGQGVNRQLPHLGDCGKGECEARREWLRGYLAGFADRLRNVRICCGDWSRVCGPSVTFRHGLTGVFLDPPYADTAERRDDLYAVDCQQVAHAVREWAIEQGKNPLMRIVLAGYQGEHEMPSDWRQHRWSAVGGYALMGDNKARENRHRETLWLSPACCDISESQKTLF